MTVVLLAHKLRDRCESGSPKSKKGHRLRLFPPPAAPEDYLRVVSGGVAYGDPNNNCDYYRQRNRKEDTGMQEVRI